MSSGTYQTGMRIIPRTATYPEGVLIVEKVSTGVAGTFIETSPEGGGWVLTWPEAQIDREFRIVTPDEHAPWLPGKFGFDDGPAWSGWWDRRHWNGWARPAFTEATLREVITYLNTDCDEPWFQINETETGPVFIQLTPGYPEEAYTLTPRTIDGVTSPVYVPDGFCFIEREEEEVARG